MSCVTQGLKIHLYQHEQWDRKLMFYNYIDLLPQSPDMTLRDVRLEKLILKILKFVNRQLIDSLYYFYKKKKLSSFDPHVGDTACQIRACHLLNIFFKKNATYHLEKRIDEIEILEIKLNEWDSSYQLNDSISLYDYISLIGCNINLNDDEFFLLLSFFLTRFKNHDYNGSTFIDYNQIAEIGNFSRKTSKKLARYYQIKLSQISCNLVIDWCHDVMPINYNNFLIKMLRHDDDDRTVLPCYFYNAIIYNYIKKKEYLTLVIVRHKYKDNTNQLMLLFNAEKYLETITDPVNVNPNLMNKPCIIIEGICNSIHVESEQAYTKRFNLIGFEDIFLANMASHPQYSGKKLSPYSVSPFSQFNDVHEEFIIQIQDELNEKRKIAKTIGCSRDDSSLFLISHIYCNILGNHLKIQNDVSLTPASYRIQTSAC